MRKIIAPHHLTNRVARIYKAPKISNSVQALKDLNSAYHYTHSQFYDVPAESEAENKILEALDLLEKALDLLESI